MGYIGAVQRRYEVLPVGDLDRVAEIVETDPSPTVPAPTPTPEPYPQPVPEPVPTPGS